MMEVYHVSKAWLLFLQYGFLPSAWCLGICNSGSLKDDYSGSLKFSFLLQDKFSDHISYFWSDFFHRCLGTPCIDNFSIDIN